MGPNGTPVLRVEDLSIQYGAHPDPIQAVNHITFDVQRGEILGLVGESGCGKSTTAMGILRLLQPPGRIVSGSVVLNGVDILKLSGRSLRAVRWRDIALVPQGAMNALNPIMTIGRQLTDAIAAHHENGRRAASPGRIAELLDLAGLAGEVRRMYPHELSGGMKQRVCIAMAVALHPALVIADEPTSALDVVVQRVIVQNLLRIKAMLGNSMIVIGHDMGLIAQLADRAAVMYAGRIVELAPVDALYKHPMHPYAQLLLATVPAFKARRSVRVAEGGPPDLRNPPPGCPFAPRCPEVMPLCRTAHPPLKAHGPGHCVACFLYD